MIAVIVCCLLIIFAILVFIFYNKTLEELFLCVGVILIFAVAFVLPLSLVEGRSIHRQDTLKYGAEKEEIEYMLENKLSIYIIDKAKQYNSEIQRGNNYWSRFNIEDRSEYMIDIDRYVNKKHK